MSLIFSDHSSLRSVNTSPCVVNLSSKSPAQFHIDETAVDDLSFAHDLVCQHMTVLV